MTRLIAMVGVACAALSLSVWAADEDESSLPIERPVQQSVVRHETLELPGLTACHQCEWRPHLHEQAAAERCGTTPDGKAKVGQFECGFSPDCERVCNFLSCLP